MINHRDLTVWLTARGEKYTQCYFFKGILYVLDSESTHSHFNDWMDCYTML